MALMINDAPMSIINVAQNANHVVSVVVSWRNTLMI